MSGGSHECDERCGGPDDQAPLTGSSFGLLAVIVMAMLAGCTVGPDFTPPASPAGRSLVPAGVSGAFVPGTRDRTQRLVAGGTVAPQWWRAFHNPQLNALEDEALRSSPTLDAAQATLAQAREAVAVARGGEFPQVDFAAAAERQKGPPFALALLPSASQGLPVFNLYTLGPTVSFLPDAFGLTARSVEAQQALAEVQGDQLAAARLTVAGNVALQALTLASLRSQIGVVQTMVAGDRKNLALVHAKRVAGRANRNDELTAQAQLASDRVLLSPLQAQRGAAEDALAVLAGQAPAGWSAPAFDLDRFVLPAQLPVSVPSVLVRQRPDILAAQAQLHARSAAIGVATAQMYPSFPLSASFGTAALATTALGTSRSLVWTLAGGLTMPIFHGGALTAQRKEAVDGFHAALAVYRETVLEAFGQVADILRALDADAALVKAARQSFDSAAAAAKLQDMALVAGRGNELERIAAERNAGQARLGYIRAQAQREMDTVRLFVAMGGGRWQDAAWCPGCGQSTQAGLVQRDDPSSRGEK